MRKFVSLLVILMIGGSVTLWAQQDPMFTKYMFNALSYNPAYAGSNGHMAIGLLHRTQWGGINGAPTTQTFTMHTPLRGDRVGVGFNLVNDKIGPTSTIGLNGVYAYRIPLSEKGTLSIGLQGGIENYQADWTKINLQVPDDNAFDYTPNLWLPNFGAGVYYSTDRFYAGFSIPHLVEYDLRKNIETDFYARQARHYFFSLGGVLPVQGDDILFRPSLLVKNVGLFSGLSKKDNFQDIGAPTEFDIDLSLLFYESFWVGVSFRSAFEAFQRDPNDERLSSFDSGDIWVSWFLENGIRIGAAYDYPLTELNQVTYGSFELMLGYEFNYKTKKIVTPRYF